MLLWLMLGILVMPRRKVKPWLTPMITIVMIGLVGLIRFVALKDTPLHSSIALAYVGHVFDGHPDIPVKNRVWYLIMTFMYVADLTFDLVLKIKFPNHMWMGRIMGVMAYVAFFLTLLLIVAMSLQSGHRRVILGMMLKWGIFVIMAIGRIIMGQSTQMVMCIFVGWMIGVLGPRTVVGPGSSMRRPTRN